MRPTFARIHLENLKYNLEYIRSKINKNAKMCVAVKADAYGHGAVECARTAVECGADFLAVATVDECCFRYYCQFGGRLAQLAAFRNWRGF